MKRDMKSNIGISQTVAPGAKTSDVTGSGVDLQGFDSAMVVINPGTITDGTHTPKVQESDDDSTYSDVAAADLEGSLAAIASNTVQRVGYKGAKRYVRLFVTVAGTTTGGVYGSVVAKGHAHVAPVS